jgi:hypothetical protein
MSSIYCANCDKLFDLAAEEDIYCSTCTKDLLCYLCQHELEDCKYEQCTTCNAKSCQHCYQMAHCDHCGELKCDDCMEEKPSACCLGCSLDSDNDDDNLM